MSGRLPREQCRGLYAITADVAQLSVELLRTQVDAAISGGACVIQYRAKEASEALRHEQASALLECCRQHQVPLLINDDVELAVRIGADGIHLGRDDMTLPAARVQLGEQAIIGASCYNSIDLAIAAEREGADYVAFGRFFASTTKPEAVGATPQLLRQAREKLTVPIVAIGGITPENGATLIEAGADMLAAIHGVFGGDDSETAARRYAQLFI